MPSQGGPDQYQEPSHPSRRRGKWLLIQAADEVAERHRLPVLPGLGWASRLMTRFAGWLEPPTGLMRAGEAAPGNPEGTRGQHAES